MPVVESDFCVFKMYFFSWSLKLNKKKCFNNNEFMSQPQIYIASVTLFPIHIYLRCLTAMSLMNDDL